MPWAIARDNTVAPGSVQDRISGIKSYRDSRLSQQAAGLLTSMDSRDAFTHRSTTGAMSLFPQLEIGTKVEQPGAALSPVDASVAAENPSFLKELNADTDQVAQMLNHNQSSELFDALLERDRTQATDFAVRNQEMHTYALHDAGDEAFRQEVRLRLSGAPQA